VANRADGSLPLWAQVLEDLRKRIADNEFVDRFPGDLELTHNGFALMVPILLATATAIAVARHVDGYSIYSARLTRPHET
jgi:hypothetical protein